MPSAHAHTRPMYRPSAPPPPAHTPWRRLSPPVPAPAWQSHYPAAPPPPPSPFPSQSPAPPRSSQTKRDSVFRPAAPQQQESCPPYTRQGSRSSPLSP